LCEWLKELIKAGLITEGEVDERSVEDIVPTDLKGYRQCHFFAGIGTWSYALQKAGWSDDRQVWTGSCPCQPFSAAGKRKGFADERHLWPAWFHLIEQCRPPVIFGEQVAGKGGYTWLDLVQADLEGCGYSIGAVDIPAGGFGAPHRRQRLYFVADSVHAEWGTVSLNREDGRDGENEGRQETYGVSGTCGKVCGMADADGEGHEKRIRKRENDGTQAGATTGQTIIERGAAGGFWANAEWLLCRDGKARAVESGTFPLAHGAPARVVRLRGYGNAIVAPVAEEVIRAYMQIL